MLKGALITFFMLLVSAGARCEVLLLDIDGPINPVVADYISDGLSNHWASAAVIRMDTPGGLMDSMRQIVKEMEAAPFPVIVYVGESPARAASAGAFITMASDVAVMARSTTIGSAHPVQMGGEGADSEAERKIVEDAAAMMRGLASKHSRNADWAERAVTESVSATASEALELNVVEYVVGSIGEMMEELEGKTVVKNGNEHVIGFEKGLTPYRMSFFRVFLNHLAHPNLAYILMLLGIYGLIYEFTNPGIGFGAAFGGICLLLAMLAFQVIPINLAGLLLIILGVILMVLDIWVPSYGILTAGGIISFVLGSLTLYDVREFPLELSLSLVAGAAAASALFFIFAAGSGIRVQFKKVTTGTEGMIGLEGASRGVLDPEGEVFVRGEIWSAVSESGRISEGEKIRVTGISGNSLNVRRYKEDTG